jgi:hypothetical protein
VARAGCAGGAARLPWAGRGACQHLPRPPPLS